MLQNVKDMLPYHAKYQLNDNYVTCMLLMLHRGGIISVLTNYYQLQAFFTYLKFAIFTSAF